METPCRKLIINFLTRRLKSNLFLNGRIEAKHGQISLEKACRQTSSFSTDFDFDLFDAKGPPKYERVLHTDPLRETRENRAKEADVIIDCMRPHLNHYRNQKYKSFDAIPLASKGWNRNKSKGDHFTIRIFGEDQEHSFRGSKASSFSQLGLHSDIVSAVESTGITNPTKIQEEAISVVLSGKNSVIAAETGCGKTLCYLLPIIQQSIEWSRNLSNRPPNSPVSLILCPSRELALQIGSIAKTLSHQLPFSCHTLIGGRTKRKMLNPEYRGIDVLIATLGATSKLTTTKIYNMSYVKHVVLDEADTMLDDSFSQLLQRFLRKLPVSSPGGTQFTLVSATMPRSIYQTIEEFVEPNSLVKVTSSGLHKVLSHVPQTFYRLGPSEKPAKLLKIAKSAAQLQIPTLIFSNNSSTCDWISLMLNENNVKALNLNGAMPLIIRMGKFDEFRRGDVSVLSCTDIASRGLDTTHVKQVVNYDFPLYMADYIHRCGRTGRCGSPSDCSVINFVSGKREVELVQQIETSVRLMQELPNVTGNITRIIQNRIDKFNQGR